MKIVIASDIYYPMTNGVAVFAHNLAGGLASQGHQVMVICPSFTGKSYTEIDPQTGVVNNYLRSVRFPFYPDQINKIPDKKAVMGVNLPRLIYKHGIWTSIYPYPEVKKILKDFQPDVIHNQTAETIALAVLAYARKYKVPLVSTGHAYPDNITGQLKILKPVKRPVDAVLRAYMASFLKNSEYATMPTEMAIEDLVPKNRKKFKVTVEALSNGVDLSAFKPGRPDPEVIKKYKIPQGVPIVLYVGRVDPEKSIEVVIESFNEIVKAEPEARMVIVGEGIDRSRLEQLVEKKNLKESVQFLGRVMPPDLIEIYRAGSVFVTASETETQGIVLIEAAAVGLPIVAVRAGAVPELCRSGFNGELSDPKDYLSMAEQILDLIRDKNKAKIYGENSQKIAAKHDLRATLKRFEEIYKIAIGLKN